MTPNRTLPRTAETKDFAHLNSHPVRSWTGKNKAFYSPGTQNGRRVIKVYGWKQFWNIWFGILWAKVLFAMHAHCMHASHIHATVDFEIWHFRAISRGEDLLFFLKTKARCSIEILVFTPRSIMPDAAFSVNHVCPFKYRTRHSEIKLWKFRFTPRVKRNFKKNPFKKNTK